FGKDQGKKDELDHRCRDCKRAYNREHAKKNASRNPDETGVPPTKRRSRGKQEKPRTALRKNQSREDGLQHYCQECKRAHGREYAKKNAARQPDEIPTPPEKRCPKCGITRPSSEWPGDRTRYDGLAAQCKPCKRAENHENGEKLRESVRRWAEANPEKVRAKQHRYRARKAGAFTEPHTPEDLREFWQFIGVDPDKCWYCALDGRDSPKEHTDHVIPLSRGGSETVWNKRP